MPPSAATPSGAWAVRRTPRALVAVLTALAAGAALAIATDPEPGTTGTPATAASPPVVPGASASGLRTALRVAAALHDLAEDLRPPSYRPPVHGRVLRPFAPPSERFGPGHRGVDLDASPGAAVRSAERGRVAHAGAVAGVTWVSVDHPDGVRTSYGPLAALEVSAGEEVERGEVLGVLADGGHGDGDGDRGLHLGARRGDTYLDPFLLPGMGAPRPTLVGGGDWWGADHAVTPYAPWEGGRLGGLLTSPSPTAEAPGYAVAPNANHLVLVAGLSSTSGVDLLDPAHLGIGPSSASRFSYAAPGADYGVEDTWLAVATAAGRLEAQLRDLARRQPGRAVDLIGHSLGGVVIAHYLLHRHDPYDVGLPPVGHVVTVASPLEGSDLARAGVALLDAPVEGAVLRAVWAAGGHLPGVAGRTARSLDPDAAALRDIASGSATLRELDDAWARARAAPDAGPLATGTRVLNVVASLDGLVGADRAALDGAERRVLPGTHAGVLGTEAVREVVWRFLAGREVVASPGRATTFLGATSGRALTTVAVLAGAGGRTAGAPARP